MPSLPPSVVITFYDYCYYCICILYYNAFGMSFTRDIAAKRNALNTLSPSHSIVHIYIYIISTIVKPPKYADVHAATAETLKAFPH